jgi:acetyl esterase/lipase
MSRLSESELSGAGWRYAIRPSPYGQRRWILGVRASVFLLVACWLTGALVSNFDSEPYATTLDISYAEGARRKLDVYYPRGTTGAPVVVFFYGGKWHYGAKEWFKFVAVTLVSHGYVVVIPDYRLFPEVKFPEFVVDGASAVRWARENIAAYGGDPRRLFMMGHSAGAYIAAMLAFDPKWLAGVGLSPGRDIAGLVGVSGPYDSLPSGDAALGDVFGGPGSVTFPISFADGCKPPALLLTGNADDVIDPRNSVRLAERLRTSGNDATDVIYRQQGHMTVFAGFVPMLANFYPAMRDVDAFVERVRLKVPRVARAR